MRSLLFHRETSFARSSESRGKVPLAPLWKDYLRFPQISLPKGRNPETSLQDTLRLRKGTLDFRGSHSPSLQDIASLLSLSARARTGEEEVDRNRRPYPSGGGFYPLEIYLAAEDAGGRSGIFHYAPERHVLEHLFPNDEGKKMFEGVRESFADPWKVDVPLYILISAVWRRTMQRYGEFGYRLVLMETGHLAQNMALAAAALRLRQRQSSAVDAEETGALLGLEEDEETVLYAIALGKES